METKGKRLLTTDDLYDIEIVNGCEISPDGRQIVYSLQKVVKESEKKFTHLWRIFSEGGKPQQLTFGEHYNTSPKWSPDGRWVAFLSNRLDKNQSQLFVLPIDGGESQAITELSGDFGGFAWSPDSQKIVFEFRKHDPEDIEIKKDEKKKDLGRVSRRVNNRVFFKLDGYGYLPQGRFHLWVVDIQNKETNQLTNSEIYDETGAIWSPDGKKIAFFSNQTEHPDLHPGKTDLYLFDLQKGPFKIVETPEGPKSKASFSHDGKHIAYIGHEGLKASYKNNELWVVDLAHPGSARSLTAKFDYDVGGGVINDSGEVITSAPQWSPDNLRIFYQVGRHGRTSLHSVDVYGSEHKVVLEFDGVVSGFSMGKAGEKIAFIYGSLSDPCQIAIKDAAKEDLTQLTSLNATLLEDIELGEMEEVWFKGADNNDLQGWIIKPPNFDPEIKYPSILEIHGGPLAQYGFFFMHEFFYLAAQGYVVYFCNPRGGQGYGEAHAKAIYHGNWGTVDYADLMAWVDCMEGQPYIDSDKMGVTGGSYGGYMTVWIIGHTDRFKAAVTQRCVSNLISMWGSSDFNWSFQSIFDDKAPYENLDVLWECSPIKHIGSAKTPTLVIHSMQDLRCAIEQSEQVYVALQNLGVDTEFLMFPDSPHGVSRTGRTDRKIVRLKGILDWFDRYISD
jgi:dipeptidyl aminopeptidase/acylaminoacyl peptidase